MKSLAFRSICILFILLRIDFAHSQQGRQVIFSKKLIGINKSNNVKVLAKVYYLPDTIIRWYLDTTSACWTFELVKTKKFSTGTLLTYDMAGNKINWAKSMDFSYNTFLQYNSTLIRIRDRQSSRIDLNTGEVLWRNPSVVYYIETLGKIGIAYTPPLHTGYTEMMSGIDLNTGNALWNRYISGLYGWDEVVHQNDSVILLTANGLHSINLNNGFGWDLITKTWRIVRTQPDYSVLLAGILTGILTGVYFTGTYNILAGISSNIIQYHNDLFFVSREKLFRIDQNGHVKWGFIMPDKDMSHSDIYLQGNNLFLINRGYIKTNIKNFEYGKPFIASYNIETGNQAYLNLIKKKKGPIIDFSYWEDSVLLIFNKGLTLFSANKGSILAEKEFDSKIPGNTIYLAAHPVYEEIVSDSQNKSFTPHSNHFFIVTRKDKILEFDKSLEHIKIYEKSNLFIEDLSTTEYKFLSNDEKTVILDKFNKWLAEIDISGSMFLVGSKLYIVSSRSFAEVNLEQFNQ